jgi:hypothetical protein
MGETALRTCHQGSPSVGGAVGPAADAVKRRHVAGPIVSGRTYAGPNQPRARRPRSARSVSVVKPHTTMAPGSRVAAHNASGVRTEADGA